MTSAFVWRITVDLIEDKGYEHRDECVAVFTRCDAGAAGSSSLIVIRTSEMRFPFTP
jgi:hypothetical protein